MSRLPDLDLDHRFRLAYALGLGLCVAVPLVLQALLGSAIRPGPEPADETIRQLGYSFSGLTFASAWFVTRRWNRIRGSLRAVPAGRRGRVLARETLLYSVLFGSSSLFGILYYTLGGPHPERYGRSFIALSTVMFFVFVPRLRAWRAAAREE